MQSTAPPSDTSHDSTPPSPTRNEAQCWKDVKAETGFSSYVEYLESLQDGGPQYKDLLERLMGMRGSRSAIGNLFLLDILKDGSTSVRSEINAGDNRMSTSEVERITTQLLQTLRSPSESVLARIVFWSFPSKYILYDSIFNVLGLGLKIQPAFFGNVFTLSWRPDKLEYVKIGDNAVTISRGYREGGCPPVLLIAGRLDNPLEDSDEWESVYRETIEELFRAETCGTNSLSSSGRSSDRIACMSSNRYFDLICKNIQQSFGMDEESQNPLLIAMSTLLHVEKLGVRVRCRIVQSALLRVQYMNENVSDSSEGYGKTVYEALDRQRFWLRRKREDIEESRSRFINYAASQGATAWLESKVWISQDEEIGEAVSEAQTREREALDYMQLQIGNLSILESRKSIELSSKQMDEAKRGKAYEQPCSKEILLITLKSKYVREGECSCPHIC